jgi:hypothetical protein
MVVGVPMVMAATFTKQFLMCTISLKNMCLKKNETDWVSLNARTSQPKHVV